LALKIHTSWDGITLAACFDSWTRLEKKHRYLPPYVCWTFWLEINLAIFEKAFPSTNVATHKALGLYFTWIDTHTNKPRLLHIKQKLALEDIPIG